MIGIESSVGFKDPREIVAGYLAQTPLAHTFFRCAEIFPLVSLALQRPVLDLGCGAGEFARLALDAAIDVGVDRSTVQLQRAWQSGRHARLIEADARRLPFRNGEMRTVISISALEHMSDPDMVVAEVSRVLMDGGRFIGTVVLADIDEHLFYPRIFRNLGLGWLGRYYESVQSRLFKHTTLMTKEQWEKIFGYFGLRLLVSRKVVSPALTRCWDLLLPAALPYKLLGQRCFLPLCRPQWLCEGIRNWLLNQVAASDGAGSVLLFVAQKDRSGQQADVKRGPWKQRKAMVAV